MDKKLVEFNESQFRVSVEMHESTGGQALQNIVDAFAGMNHGQIRNTDELGYLINDPQGFVVDRLNQGRSVQLLGLTIKKSKVFELLEELPAGWDQLQAAINNYKQIRSQYPVRDFDLVKGKVLLSDEKKAALEEDAKTYLSNERQIRAFEAAEKIKPILEEFARHHGEGGAKKLLKAIDIRGVVDSSNPDSHLIPPTVKIDLGEIKGFENVGDLEAARKKRGYELHS